MTARTLVIGDIGGTNARFAMASSQKPGFANAATFKCADFPSADDAIKQYLADLAAAAPEAICLAAAGPLIGNSIQMTNNHWTLNAERISADFGINAVRLLNDFEAAAYSVLELGIEGSDIVGLPDRRPSLDRDFSVAILGPGTGLGAAGLIRRGNDTHAIVGEGGHIGFAPKSQVQVDILNVLRSKFDRVSVERLVSGAGIENIYWALTRIHGEQRTPLSASEIFSAGGDKGDTRAVESVQLFFEILGQVASDIALTLGAKDGVYIAGGITKRDPSLFMNSGFRNAFDDKGRHRAYMEQIPTLLITHEEPGLLGAAYCARRLSSS